MNSDWHITNPAGSHATLYSVKDMHLYCYRPIVIQRESIQSFPLCIAVFVKSLITNSNNSNNNAFILRG